MWRLGAFVLLVASLAIAIACGNGDGDGETSDATSTPQPGVTDLPRTENEGGAAPIFWRTADKFESVRADEPYKVLFRITNGYDEDTISMVAVRNGDGEEIPITSDRAEPVGDDLPGSYYPTFLQLSEVGTWELTIVAGNDETTIQFEVAEPAG